MMNPLQFFRDLFGPRKPCDLCQLGKTEGFRPGSVEWNSVAFTHEGKEIRVDASLLVCLVCSDRLQSRGLMFKSPAVVQALFVAEGICNRPNIETLLHHPEWRKVWSAQVTMACDRPDITTFRNHPDGRKIWAAYVGMIDGELDVTKPVVVDAVRDLEQWLYDELVNRRR